MAKIGLFFLICLASVFLSAVTNIAVEFEQDTFPTSRGDLKITFIGHGTLMLEWAGKVIHVDPVSNLADFSSLPKADLILVTHEHGDHFDAKAIELLRKADTQVIITEKGAAKLESGIVMKNGQTLTRQGIKIEAIPAYNIVHMRSQNTPYHPKGDGNGYILNLGEKRIYIAGDTENTPEMKALQNIDIAFLPMNLPYTMTPEMVADAARAFKPKILYPYHFGSTETAQLVSLLKNQSEIEVRIRKMS
jgi:L-ascorbate metabolism protein UlaG (beta-lactamase superfamily)